MSKVEDHFGDVLSLDLLLTCYCWTEEWGGEQAAVRADLVLEMTKICLGVFTYVETQK